MKTKTINIILLTFILLLGISSCSTENESLVSDNSAKSKLSISATDNGFSAEAGGTRATTATDFTTTFVSGDKMGMFVTDGSNVVVSNICLTYDGTTWAAANAGDAFYYDSNSMSGYQFFAYYPYTASASLEGVPAAGAATTATDADAFFSAVKTGWTVKTDQSTAANYTASDLMIGKGTIGPLTNDEYPLSFTLNHAMSLVEINVPAHTFTLSTDASYTRGIYDYVWTGFTPYNISTGVYRYISNPATSGTYTGTTDFGGSSLPSFTPTLSAGKYHQIFINKASLTNFTHTLAIGDYLLSDGSLVPYSTTNTALLAKLSRAVGVVTSVSPSEADKSAGYKHGYVMALQNASTSAAWSNSTSYDEVLQNHETQTYEKFITYKDGRLKTDTIVSLDQAKQAYSATTYPAHYAAVNFSGTVAVPTGCSHWYLPSIGQMYDVAVNLCSQTEVPSNSLTGYCYWSGTSSAAATALSAYMTKVSSNGGTATGFTNSNEYYWTSSEYSSSLAYSLNFGSGGSLYLSRGSKDNTYYVRPFLAF